MVHDLDGAMVSDIEWPDGLKVIEVIELTGPVDTAVCMVGIWPPETTVACVAVYRHDKLVYEKNFALRPDLPMAELLNHLEEGCRKDASEKGARLEIFEIPAPYGQEEFKQVLAARRTASCQTCGGQSKPTASDSPNLR